MKRFDAYEIAPVAKLVGGGDERQDDELTALRLVKDGVAEDVYWTLFGHIQERGAMCIGDFETYEEAAEIYFRITGRDAPDKSGVHVGMMA